MRQFKKKLKLAMKASKHFWTHAVKSSHVKPDDAYNYRFETKVIIRRDKRTLRTGSSKLSKKLS